MSTISPSNHKRSESLEGLMQNTRDFGHEMNAKKDRKSNKYRIMMEEG